jgi:hypothetical protein
MALDPGPLVALVAGGAMGALMRWAGPRARGWRRRLDARPALRRGVMVLAAGTTLAGGAALAVHPAWLDEALAWAQYTPAPAGEACPSAEGADRPAVALARWVACRREPA